MTPIQISFLMGVIALVGFKNAIGFFSRESKIKGSVFFFVGLVLIVTGWYLFTFLGFLAQLYGIFLLFRSFIGTILVYAQSLPFIGGFLRSSDAVHKAVKIIENTDGKKRSKFEV
jgi:hypothetical protein